MFIKFLSCVIFIFYINGVAFSLPIPNLFGSFSVPKVIPFRANFNIQTSLGNPNIIESLSSRTHSNRFDVIPRADTDKSNIARNDNILTVKLKKTDDVTATTNTFKNNTILTDTDTSILSFNDDNSITDVNKEAEFSSISNTEFTTDFTTTEDYESTTTAIEEEILNRSGVSPDVLASLLGG